MEARMHRKLRIELIIERMAYKRACRVLKESGMTGYTVIPALAGSGGRTEWRRDSDISASRDMVVIISIGDAERVETAIEKIEGLLGRHIGVVTVSEVNVIRDGRF